MLKVSEYSKIDDELVEKWNALWKKAYNKTFFNSYDWFKICHDVFSYEKILIIGIFNGDDLVALLPLVSFKKYFVSPGERYLDNTTLLVRKNSKEIILCLTDYIKNNKYQIILNEVPLEITERFDVLNEFASDNPKADLTDGIQNIIKHKELRYLKRIKEKNKNYISFDIYSGPRSFDEINRIFKIEQSSSKIKSKKDLFSDEKARKLFRNISKTKSSFLIILRYNDLDIAHLFSVCDSNKVMAYHMAYNYDYAYLQPGKLIFLELMEYMISKNFEILDFSRGNSILKRHFSNGNVKKYNIYINCNIFKSFFVYIHKFIFKVKGTLFYKKIKKLIKRK